MVACTVLGLYTSAVPVEQKICSMPNQSAKDVYKRQEHSQLNLSQVNKDVLKKWDENDVFAKSMTEREGCPSFVFYEGPPSANGMPGIHHVMARTIKDTFCRYKTMKGFQVKRKAGYRLLNLSLFYYLPRLITVSCNGKCFL